MAKVRLKSKSINLKKNIIILTVISILFNVSLFIIYYNKKTMPIVSKIASTKLQEISSTLIINNLQNDIIKDIDINKLIIPRYNKSNEIIAIDYQLQNLYTMVKNINKSLQQSIKNIETGNVSLVVDEDIFMNKNSGLILAVPSLIFTNNSFLTNLGPKLPTKLIYIGNVFTNFNTKVTSYGLNNALLEIYLVIEVSNNLIIPLNTQPINSKFEILVGAKAIQGQVPSFYNGTITNDSQKISIPLN